MQGGAKNPRTLKRIAVELEKLQNKDPLPYATVSLKDKSELLLWTVTMTGPVRRPLLSTTHRATRRERLPRVWGLG